MVETIIFFILGIIIGFAVMAMISRMRKAQNDEDSHNTDDGTDSVEADMRNTQQVNDGGQSTGAENKYEGMNNAVLMKAILEDINCQYTETENGQLLFIFQGENFAIIDSPESVWIRIIDIQWYNCPLDNLEEMACMQKAINTANAVQTCNAMYDIDKNANKMIVYSKYDMVISSNTDHPDQLLLACLADFFRLKQKVVLEFEKEKQRIGIE